MSLRGLKFNSAFFCLFFFMVLMTFGCAAPQKIVLTPEGEGKLQKTRIVSIIPQEEITAEIKESRTTQAMGGGALFALIDSSINSSRSKKMEKSIADIKTTLSDYDFREKFWERLRAEMAEPGRLMISQLETTVKPTPWNKEKELINLSEENSVLVLNTKYGLTNDYRRLKLDSTARLWVNGENRAVYAQAYDIELSPDDLGPEDDPIPFWVENNGENLRNLLEAGIQETMNRLRNGLLNP